jgi:hypothetical protein
MFRRWQDASRFRRFAISEVAAGTRSMLALCLPSRYQSISDIGVGETVESLVSKAVAPELQLE